MRYAIILTLLTGVLPTTATAGEANNEARVRDAVDRGLKFLASQQKKSGAWEMRGRAESPAVTSLVVMAFLSSGHVPGEGPYGDNLNRAIDWVLDQQTGVSKVKGKETILFKSRIPTFLMYSHGICTTMLAEVVNLLPKKRADRVRTTLQKAIRLIIVAQKIKKGPRHLGGWRYLPRSRDSDLTVTGWQVSALKAAQSAGFEVPKETFDNAAAYILKTAHPRTGGFSYQPRVNPTATRCAVGIVSLMLCGKRKAPEIDAAVKYARRRPLRSGDTHFLYGCYYTTAAFRKIGGADWTRQRKFVHATFLKSQDKNGGWTGVVRRRSRYGDSYTAAVALLTLTLERGILAIHRR